MARTLGEWRRGASNCRGALIWLFRDLWPGAGWGIVDAHGRPKAAYYFVKRALQPRAVFLSDEGVNGLSIELVNDRPGTLSAEVELSLIRGGSTRVASGRARIEIGPRATLSIPASTLLEHFIDLTHAYRFGPPAYDVAVVTLLDATTGERLSDACHFPGGLPSTRSDVPGIEACVHEDPAGSFELRVTSAAFAHSLAIEVPGFVPDDSFFNLAPGQSRRIALRSAPPIEGARVRAKPAGMVVALNAHSPVRITLAAVPAG
jgi:beta-mannosidase